MTFEEKASSRNAGRPLTLYYFKYGTEPNAFFAYTDSEEKIVYEGVTYNPIPITMGNITASGNLDKSTFTISVPKTAGLAELFMFYPLGSTVSVIVRQGHVNDGEYLVVQNGRNTSSRRSASQVDISFQPITTMMLRVGLRRHYQLSCPHALYGEGCFANKLAATVNSTVINAAGSKLTLPVNWNVIPIEKYIGGMVGWMTSIGKEYRTILRTPSATVLSLSGPLQQLKVGDPVEIILGCNHQMNDCLNMHNNIHNFGGMPFIPTKNPVNTNPYN